MSFFRCCADTRGVLEISAILARRVGIHTFELLGETAGILNADALHDFGQKEIRLLQITLGNLHPLDLDIAGGGVARARLEKANEMAGMQMELLGKRGDGKRGGNVVLNVAKHLADPRFGKRVQSDILTHRVSDIFGKQSGDGGLDVQRINERVALCVLDIPLFGVTVTLCGSEREVI